MWIYFVVAAVQSVNAGIQVAIGNHYTAMFCFFVLGFCFALWFADWVNTRAFGEIDAVLDDLQKRIDETASEDQP